MEGLKFYPNSLGHMINMAAMPIYNIQSTLVISKSKGPSETL